MLFVSLGLKNILPITTAKVPIVKFEHRQSLLEGDISLYNTLVSFVFYTTPPAATPTSTSY
jgi:DNA polymerase sigma